jgi:hypothetical protein
MPTISRLFQVARHPQYPLRRSLIVAAPPAARRGASSAFEDPTATARVAPVLWDGRIASHVVTAQVMDSADRFGRAKPFAFSALSCTRTAYEDACGSTHLLLRQGTVSIQLAIQNPVDLTQQTYVSLLVESAARLKNVERAMEQLEALRDDFDAPHTLPHSQFDAHLRDYVVALDAHVAGKSYREIAQILYGSELVKDVWTSETHYLKDKVRRCVQRGLALRDGGYLTLLA